MSYIGIDLSPEGEKKATAQYKRTAKRPPKEGSRMVSLSLFDPAVVLEFDGQHWHMIHVTSGRMFLIIQ